MAPLQIEQLPEQWRECRWHQNGNLFASILESHLPEVQGIIANLRRDATLKRVDLKTLATLREWRRAVSTALGSAMAYPYCDVPQNIENMKQERDNALRDLGQAQGVIARLQTRLSAQEWRTDHWHNIAVKADAARDAALQEHALMMQDANSTVETYRARVNVLVRERAAARRTLIALQRVAWEVVDSLPERALAIFSLSKWIKKLAARLPAVEGQKP